MAGQRAELGTPRKDLDFFRKYSAQFLIKIQIAAKYIDRNNMDSDKPVEQFAADIEDTLRNKLF